MPVSVRGRRRPVVIALACTLVAALAFAVALPLAIPKPTGPYTVGRLRETWIDDSRPEPHTEIETDRRAVPLHVWFPAAAGSGRAAPYLPDLGAIADALVASGEVRRWHVWGLPFVRDHARVDALISPERATYPVVVLSPGNATNVAFYSTIAEDLASHGYVVVGVDHPYHVAAVSLPDGTIATYDARPDALPPGERQAAVARKIDERVADIAFVLERLTSRAPDVAFLAGRLDLDRVGVMGHSNGGLAAVELCRRDARLRACLNVDGQQEGGPFSVTPGGTAPQQPFMFLTKETALHPTLAAEFEAAGEGAYRVVIPEATHQHFTDGPLFQPLPFSRPAQRVLTTVRGFTRAFFDRHLAGDPTGTPLGDPAGALAHIPAPADVYVNVYPLGGKPPLPIRG